MTPAESFAAALDRVYGLIETEPVRELSREAERELYGISDADDYEEDAYLDDIDERYDSGDRSLYPGLF